MKSLRKAINDKCTDCIYDPLAGGTRIRQIAACSCPDCPLYPVRPMPRGRGSSSSTDNKLRDEMGRIMKKPVVEIEL